MSDINFQPVFDYIDQNNQVLGEQILGHVDEQLREVKTSIDNLSSQVKTYHEEMLISGHRLDRLEGWGKIVSTKINVPLKF